MPFLGVGMVLVVAPFYAESIRHQLSDAGLNNWIIGRVRKGPHGVVWAADGGRCEGK